MVRSHLAILALIAGITTSSSVWAQSTDTKTAPAEFPPASFKGTQYVDSRGCVYIRAGVDGNVSWIPRLTRRRTHICGMQPTQVAGATAAPQRQSREVIQITLEPEDVAPQPAPAPEAAPAPRRTAATSVAQAIRRAPAPVTRAAAPTPKPKKPPVTIAATRPAPQPKPEAQTQARPRPTTPAPIVAAAPKAKPAQRPITLTPEPVQPAAVPVVPQVQTQRTTASTACPGKTRLSQQYLGNESEFPVRCGSQSDTSFTNGVPAQQQAARAATRGPVPSLLRSRTSEAVPSTSLPGSTRVLPRHVAEQRARVGQFAVPEGYRPAWNDGRLNPRRAEGSLAGRDQMNLVWTSTVPRRLIDSNSGRDMTAKVALVYPFTDFAVQSRELGQVTLITRNGQTMKRIVKNGGKRKVTKEAAKAERAARTVVSTRSSAQAVQTPKSAARTSGRYVQIGTYGVPNNAQKAARSLQRLGLPARIGRVTRKGKALQTVVAGPFTDQASLNGALRAVRSAGYKDAFVRK